MQQLHSFTLSLGSEKLKDIKPMINHLVNYAACPLRYKAVFLIIRNH